MQFLFVRPRFCPRLLSDSASRRTPLSLANSSYCQTCNRLSPSSGYACRAHKINPTQRYTMPDFVFVNSKYAKHFSSGLSNLVFTINHIVIADIRNNIKILLFGIACITCVTSSLTIGFPMLNKNIAAIDITVDSNPIPFKINVIYQIQKFLFFDNNDITAEKTIGRIIPLRPIKTLPIFLIFVILQRMFGKGSKLNSNISAPDKTAAKE